jgi:hypothetical protein
MGLVGLNSGIDSESEVALFAVPRFSHVRVIGVRSTNAFANLDCRPWE